MVESDSYHSDHFPIVLKVCVSLPDALLRWNFNRADWVQFDHLCKENWHCIQQNCMKNQLFCLLMFYVILTRVVCQEPQSRNAVILGLIRNAKT